MAKVTFLSILQWSEGECREYLERQRWPDGPICPKCGAPEPYIINRKSATKNIVRKLYRCKACKRQYTATVGTIFEDSKIPLNKWFAAIYLMCSSKKGVSAHQIHRSLDITYKSAWFMCHRIREAMRDKDGLLLSGTVESDETYIGPRRRRGHPLMHERIRDEIDMGLREAPKKGRYWQEGKAIVFGIVERGGRVVTAHVKEATSNELRPILLNNIDVKKSRLITDAHPAYRLIRNHLPHDVIRHESEYVRGDVHTQNIEGYWSLLKRGLYGTFHHVDEGYLENYLNEFSFRFNRRKISDAERFASAMGQTRGRLTWYCQTPQPENPFA